MTEAFLTLTSRLDKDLASQESHVTRLARRIGKNAGLTATKLVTLKKAALPHDIGKIFIPEEIIHNKPGPLTKSEKSVDRRHPLLGNWLLAGFSSFNQEVVIIVAHHEKWDGS